MCLWEVSWTIREVLLNKNAPKSVPRMVELGTPCLILKTKTTQKKIRAKPTIKTKPTKPDGLRWLSGNEQSWCCTPWHVGSCGGGWPPQANSLVGRRVLVGRRQAKVHSLLSESHSLPSRIKMRPRDSHRKYF